MTIVVIYRDSVVHRYDGNNGLTLTRNNYGEPLRASIYHSIIHPVTAILDKIQFQRRKFVQLMLAVSKI